MMITARSSPPFIPLGRTKTDAYPNFDASSKTCLPPKTKQALQIPLISPKMEYMGTYGAYQIKLSTNLNLRLTSAQKLTNYNNIK
jgi:hypothetical protein